MKQMHFFLFAASWLGGLLAGCHKPTPSVPVNLAEHSQLRRHSPQVFPDSTVLMVNLQRVLDDQLAPNDRVASLAVVEKLGSHDANVRQQLAGLLGRRRQLPPSLGGAILSVLLQAGHEELAGHVVQSLPHIRGQDRLTRLAMDWLMEHPDAAALPEVIKLWAACDSAGPDELRFRLLVTRLSGSDWPQALLDCINQPDFHARGSAVELLARHLTSAEALARARLMTPQTQAMSALRLCLELFDYVPANGDQFAAATALCISRASALKGASEVAQAWRQDNGYRFNIRDLHLLAALAADTSRLRQTSSGDLRARLAALLSERRHVSIQGVGQRRLGDGSLNSAAAALTLADLWNILLLGEMLDRPTVQSGLRVVAGKDQADTRSAWGGLVFHRDGQATAMLYEPARQADNDLAYVPSQQARTEGRDALCMFHARFDKPDNVLRAGPDADDLAASAAGNYYGLVLTSIGQDAFCAHYYNPAGAVVSLGTWPFGQ